MSIQPPRTWQSAPGKRPICQRLEHVRTHFGVKTLRDFWRALSEVEGFGYSYEAARNYHYDRDPPVDYLAAVSRLYGVRLDFLIFGEGPLVEPSPGDDGDAHVANWLRREFSGFDDLPAWAREVVNAAVRRIADDQMLGRSAGFSPDEVKANRREEEAEAAFYVARALAVPLERAGADWGRVWEHQRGLYAAGIAQALIALIPNPGERLALEELREADLDEKAQRQTERRRRERATKGSA